MSIQKEIVLRYHSSGHVRFQLPERLCTQAIAIHLEQAMSQFGGVYRVTLQVRQKKLIIRYSEEICAFELLAKELFSLLAEFEANGFPQATPSAAKKSPSTTHRLKQVLNKWRSVRWAKDKYTETKETAQAVGVLAKFGLKNKPDFLKDPEKTAIDFCNDVLVLYLIKTHWHTITQHWLLNPIRYRYEWTATFYLMYLLMRSKIPKK